MELQQYSFPHLYKPIPSTVTFLPDLRTIPYQPYEYAPLDLSLKSSTVNVEDYAGPEAKKLKFSQQFFDDLKESLSNEEKTPSSKEDREQPIEDRPKKSPPKPLPTKKSKAVRKLTFDEDKSSPVSGTIIRELDDDETLVVRKGDIDPAFNVVEVTEEAKSLIAAIDNKLGSYICRLCRSLYEDAFALAQHRCSRIVHIEYRCPECDKVFNCPANLASHRRWHKPRPNAINKSVKKSEQSKESSEQRYTCKVCNKIFKRHAYLRKHTLSHEIELNKPPCDISAFREVRSSKDLMRDDNHNNYWDNMQALPYYESLQRTENLSVNSEDSRDLDITGSEDEGIDEGRWNEASN